MRNSRVATLWAAGIAVQAQNLRSYELGGEEVANPNVLSVHTLWSYSMMIGVRWKVKGPFGTAYVVFWISGEKVSKSTSRHQSLARRAMSASAPFVDDGVGQKVTLLGTLQELALRGSSDPRWPFPWVGPLADWLSEQEEKREPTLAKEKL